MFQSTKIILALALIATLAACSKGGSPIGDDGAYAGTLTPAHRTMDDGSAYEKYTIELAAGEELDLIMQSGDFDAFLHVEGPKGMVIGQDDDSGGGSNAHLVIIAPDSGSYTIFANAFSEQEFGDYLLSVRRRTSGQLDHVYRGELAQADVKSFATFTYPTHEIDARAGERIDLILTSGEFDAYLIVEDPAGNTIAEDDDGAGGTNARLSVPIRADGIYTAIVKSYEDDSAGAYLLTVRRGASDEGMAGDADEERIDGRLSAENEKLDDGTPYAVHVIDAKVGDVIDIELESDDFDAYLQVWTADDDRLLEDDDSGNELNSRGSITIPADGTYKIIANSVGEDAAGAYTLTLRRSSIADEIASGEIDLFTGALTADNDTMQDGSPYSAHEIVAKAGDRLEVTMMSVGFDAYLMVFDGDDNKLAEDDDSAGGGNARLLVMIPADGTYRIIANSYDEDAAGSYAITVSRK